MIPLYGHTPQARSDNIEVRVNTLEVLCEEFKNPSIIAGVTNAGLMRYTGGVVGLVDTACEKPAAVLIAIGSVKAITRTTAVQDQDRLRIQRFGFLKATGATEASHTSFRQSMVGGTVHDSRSWCAHGASCRTAVR